MKVRLLDWGVAWAPRKACPFSPSAVARRNDHVNAIPVRTESRGQRAGRVAESGETRLHSPRCRFGHNVDMDAAPPEHPWLHEQLAIQESAIEGKGLFATEDLPADLVVIRLAGRLVSSSELASLIGEAKADPSAPMSIL